MAKLLKQYPHIQVLGGIRFKFHSVRSGRTLRQDLQIGKSRCTAVVTTGDGTEQMTPRQKLMEFRQLLGDYPLLAGAGISAETVADTLRYSDGAIVGSWFKEAHCAVGDVNKEYVKQLMEQAKKI